VPPFVLVGDFVISVIFQRMGHFFVRATAIKRFGVTMFAFNGSDQHCVVSTDNRLRVWKVIMIGASGLSFLLKSLLLVLGLLMPTTCGERPPQEVVHIHFLEQQGSGKLDALNFSTGFS